MRCVTGLGGVFFKAKNPEKLYEWYEKHLGIKQDVPGQGVSFLWERGWRSGGVRLLVDFSARHKYFQPSTKPFMLNFCVEGLDGLREKLRGEGVWIDPNREDYDYRRFAWIVDPEGNRIELWKPPRRS